MHKTAQAAKTKKVFKDPVRQKLEDDKSLLAQHKKDWNNKIKSFNQELKKLKNELHGNVEGKERIHLNEKLPEDLPGKILQLADYFNQQAQKAEKIVNFQSEIANRSSEFFGALEEKRKKIKARQEGKAEAALEDDYNLVAEGIHPLSLQWQKAKGIFGNQEQKSKAKALDRLYRLDRLFSKAEELTLAISSEEDFKKLEPIIINILSLTNSVKKNIELDYDILQRKMRGETVSADEPQKELPTSSDEQEVTEGSENDNIKMAHKIIDDVKYFNALKTTILSIHKDDEKLKGILEIFNKKINDIEKLGYQIIDGKIPHTRVESLFSKYEDFINNTFSHLALTHNVDLWVGPATSLEYFKNCFNNLRGKDISSADDNYVYDPLSIKLKKLKRHVTFDEDKKIFYDLFRENRVKLETLMGDLVKEFDINNVRAKFSEIEKNNQILQKKINLMRSGYSLTEKEIAQQEKAVEKSLFRRMFKGLLAET